MSWTSSLAYVLDQYWVDNQDPRTKDFLSAQFNLAHVLLIAACYNTLVVWVIPNWLKNRKPLELRWPIMAHNTTMVMLNFLLFNHYVRSLKMGRRLFDFVMPSADDFSPETLYEININYFYYGTKFLDLFDTLFFVLRKKNSQLSFLHLYHHTLVPLVGWFAFRFRGLPNIQFIYLMGTVNSLIHTLMYSYYALSALGPEMAKLLWWKKYITQLQILQFVVYLVYLVALGFNHRDYPMGWVYFFAPQGFLFLYMFYDFYRKAYDKPKRRQL